MFDHSNLYKSSPEEEEIAAGNGITPVRLFIHLKLLSAKDFEDVKVLERNEGKKGLNRLHCGVVVRVLDWRYIHKTGLSEGYGHPRICPRWLGIFLGGRGKVKGNMWVHACMETVHGEGGIVAGEGLKKDWKNVNTHAYKRRKVVYKY